jgi:hypothetical protein
LRPIDPLRREGHEGEPASTSAAGCRAGSGTQVVAVEQPFDMPVIDQETGEVLDRALVSSLSLPG